MKKERGIQTVGRHQQFLPLQPDGSLFVNQQVPTLCHCQRCRNRVLASGLLVRLRSWLGSRAVRVQTVGSQSKATPSLA